MQRSIARRWALLQLISCSASAAAVAVPNGYIAVMADSDSSVPSPCPLPAKKRKTYSDQEKELLIDIISKTADHEILTSPSNTKEAITRKKAVWQHVMKEFACAGGGEWDLEQIKTWYRNSRRDAKTAVRELKAHRTATGGGPPAADLPADKVRMLQILGDDVKPLDNPNDSDAAYMTDCEVIAADTHGIGKKTPQSAGKQSPGSFLKRKLVVKQELEAAHDSANQRKQQNEAVMANLKLEHQKISLECDLLAKQIQLVDMKIAREQRLMANVTGQATDGYTNSYYTFDSAGISS